MRVVDNYACAYNPPNIAVFTLSPNSSVAARPDLFGIARSRAHAGCLAALPADVGARLPDLWDVAERELEGRFA